MREARTAGAEAILALTLYGEADSYNEADALMIAATVFNRIDDRGWWGDSVPSVCLTEWQYSCWNWTIKERRRFDQGDADQKARLTPYLFGDKPGTPDVAKLEAAQGWLGECLRIARKAWDAAEAPGWPDADPTKGASSYHTTYIRPPNWTKKGRETARSVFRRGGGHIFYELSVLGRSSDAPRASPVPLPKPSDVGKTAGGGLSGGGLADQILTGGEGREAVLSLLRAIFLRPDGSANAAAFALLFLVVAAGVGWWCWRDWRQRREWSARAPWMEDEVEAPASVVSTPTAPAIPDDRLAAVLERMDARLERLEAANPETPKPAPRRRAAAKTQP